MKNKFFNIKPGLLGHSNEPFQHFLWTKITSGFYLHLIG